MSGIPPMTDCEFKRRRPRIINQVRIVIHRMARNLCRMLNVEVENHHATP
jgi:hypothetical protein